jgi:hypothetical protein
MKKSLTFILMILFLFPAIGRAQTNASLENERRTQAEARDRQIRAMTNNREAQINATERNRETQQAAHDRQTETLENSREQQIKTLEANRSNQARIRDSQTKALEQTRQQQIQAFDANREAQGRVRDNQIASTESAREQFNRSLENNRAIAPERVSGGGSNNPASVNYPSPGNQLIFVPKPLEPIKRPVFDTSTIDFRAIREKNDIAIRKARDDLRASGSYLRQESFENASKRFSIVREQFDKERQQLRDASRNSANNNSGRTATRNQY